MNRLKEKFNKEIKKKLKKELKLDNDHEVPFLSKITLNIGAGKASEDKTLLENYESTLNRITGQKSVKTKSKRAVSGFGTRKGQIVGVMVTLRGERMYAFFDKFVNVALPRVRDFRGIPYSVVDQRGNLAVGLREHTAFPEINPDEVEKIHGLEVVITIKAKERDHSIRMLEMMGFPFTKEKIEKSKDKKKKKDKKANEPKK